MHEESVGQGGRDENGAPAVSGLGQETSWALALLLSNTGVLGVAWADLSAHAQVVLAICMQHAASEERGALMACSHSCP